LKEKDARDIAVRLSKTSFKKARMEDNNGCFELFEDGIKTEWSI